jgi:NADH:ubiquinone oxidoreductase subunit 2 (subunit N)
VILELNTIAYCRLNFDTPKESMLKYFVIQTIASALLIFGGVIRYSFLIRIALIIKLAAAPFHFWFISVCKKRSWINNKILLTWQKLMPIYLVMYTAKSLLLFFVLLSATIGSVFLINKKSFKEILALSSVFNLS